MSEVLCGRTTSFSLCWAGLPPNQHAANRQTMPAALGVQTTISRNLLLAADITQHAVVRSIVPVVLAMRSCTAALGCVERQAGHARSRQVILKRAVINGTALHKSSSCEGGSALLCCSAIKRNDVCHGMQNRSTGTW